MTVATRLYNVARSIVIGIGQGFQPIAGYNYGAGEYGRVRRCFWSAVAMGTAVAAGITLLFAVFAPQLVVLFLKNEPAVTDIGIKAVYLLCLSMPTLAFSTYVNQLLQCLSQVKSATFLAMCRNCIMYIPLILLLPVQFGVLGIQLAQPLADILTALISVPFLLSFMRRLNRMPALQSRKPTIQ